MPGRGHSSPTVVGRRIYLTTADTGTETQSLLVFDRKSGQLVRQTVAHRGGLPQKIHPNNTHASPTVASDGQRVFALFYNGDAAWVTAFDLEGEKLWQQRAIGFDPQQYQFGFGSSPVLVDGLVIVASEYDGQESGVVALDAQTGQHRWTTPRPKLLSYSSPARALIRGETHLLLSGNNQLAAYLPATGRQLWSTPGATQATCGTMVFDPASGLAFASGGYPVNFTCAVQTSGNHAIQWQNNVKCYEQSMLIVDGHLFGISDIGVAYCWRAADGEEMWKSRLGGKFSSSPLLVDGRIYVTNEAGTTYVFASDPSEFRSLATNQLGTEAFATPTPADGRLYHRFANDENSQLQEYLVAIGP